MKILVSLILIFLVACSQPMDRPIDNLPEFQTDTVQPNADLPSTITCTSEWTCLDKDTKILRLENCSFGERETCQFGCENVTCNSPPVCEVGFKCKGQHLKGYQQLDCSWINTKKCEFGCENAECLAEPNVAVEPEAVAPVSKSILTTEVQDIQGHNVSIFLIEESRVMIKIDGKRSDWLEEGDSFTREITITVEDIFFQSYLGGKQEITYTLG